MRSVTPSGQRADDWICTSIIRFTRPAPFSVEPRRQIKKGDRRELNPHLLLHRQACLPRTPRTPCCLTLFVTSGSAEREGIEPSRP